MRNYALVILGFNSVLRISDILNLTWGDVFDFQEKQFKSHVYVKENKINTDKFIRQKFGLDRRDFSVTIKDTVNWQTLYMRVKFALIN